MVVLADKKRRAATPNDERITSPERHGVAAGKISVFDAVRAFGVMAGPSVLFDLFLVGSVIATIRKVLTRPRTNASRGLRPLVTFGTALAVAYPAVIRPWMMRWGATDEERRVPLPGDELVLDPSRLSFAERVMVKAVRAPEGDFRDWQAIDAWAASIARALG